MRSTEWTSSCFFFTSISLCTLLRIKILIDWYRVRKRFFSLWMHCMLTETVLLEFYWSKLKCEAGELASRSCPSWHQWKVKVHWHQRCWRAGRCDRATWRRSGHSASPLDQDTLDECRDTVNTRTTGNTHTGRTSAHYKDEKVLIKSPLATAWAALCDGPVHLLSVCRQNAKTRFSQN